ncbi:hypothetical protein C8R47DRAFT_759338 [Mycena vitilis]|nr:hypothetical protein C8R47DRAFT_759338 [Mycena vitilis]
MSLVLRTKTDTASSATRSCRLRQLYFPAAQMGNPIHLRSVPSSIRRRRYDTMCALKRPFEASITPIRPVRYVVEHTLGNFSIDAQIRFTHRRDFVARQRSDHSQTSVPPSSNSSAPTPFHATVMKDGIPCPLAPRRRFFPRAVPTPRARLHPRMDIQVRPPLLSPSKFFANSPLGSNVLPRIPHTSPPAAFVRSSGICLRSCPPGPMARCCLVYVSLRVLPHRTDRSRLPNK